MVHSDISQLTDPFTLNNRNSTYRTTTSTTDLPGSGHQKCSDLGVSEQVPELKEYGGLFSSYMKKIQLLKGGFTLPDLGWKWSKLPNLTSASTANRPKVEMLEPSPPV